MRPASEPLQRPLDAKLLTIDRKGRIGHVARSQFHTCLRPGDLVVANDAAALPSSLRGVHVRTGRPIEVRLAGRRSLDDIRDFTAILFGEGDFHTRTEDRPAPPPLQSGDRLELGPLRGTVQKLFDHARLVELRFEGSVNEIWAGLARHGRLIQYAYLPDVLELWDAWAPIAARPVAFEAPSAGFLIGWKTVGQIRTCGAEFATLTHTAGISSTGDVELDRRLPFDEPYRISEATARAIDRAKTQGGRIVAIGTTVVRALEHAALENGRVQAGDNLATQIIGPNTKLRVVDIIITGAHEPGTSHHQLLHAFADQATLRRAESELEARDYRTHEFGDSVLIERQPF